MNSQGPLLTQRQTDWLANQLQERLGESLLNLGAVSGDGSTRRFVRAFTRSQSVIVLIDSDWRQSQDYWPLQDYLKRHNTRVPEFIAQSPQDGLLIMEDLGDTALQAAILQSPQKRSHYLTRAIETLAAVHGGTYPVPLSIPAAHRTFDEKKLLDELQYFETHFLQGLLKLPPSNHSTIEAFKTLVGVIARVRPLVFTHRDYHTRNIMLHHDELVLIDFQDARLGSPHYDLASMIYDPYIALAKTERDALSSHYGAAIARYALSKEIHWKTFESDTHHIALQRLIKAVGSFAAFAQVQGKEAYLKYIHPALSMASELPHGNLPIGHWLETFEKAKLTE